MLVQLQRKELAKLDAASVAGLPAVLERPRHEARGDFATAVALRLSKQAGLKPLDLAELLAERLAELPEVEQAQAAAPGFVNITLTASARGEAAGQALLEPEDFGRPPPESQPGSALVEFVSSNPTGPLHVGHGRGAAYGDSVARVLRHARWQVRTEYYLNDRGRQIDILAASLWLRALELRGLLAGALPAGCYAGDYLIGIARSFAAEHPDLPYCALDMEGLAADQDEAAVQVAGRVRQALGAGRFRQLAAFAVASICAGMKQELAAFRVSFDNWFSEAEMIAAGKVEPALQRLAAAGATYSKDGALWFKSAAYGDEKDRVLVRSDGETTYFASDVAYHLDKYSRKHDRFVNIFGADHHGYVPRLRGFIAALGEDPDRLEVPLVHLLALVRGGKRLKITTRGGVFSTLSELREAVGVDAARLFMVMQKVDSPMEFDLDLAVRQSNENPVYYVQYAHARCCSLLARWGGDREQLRLAPELLGELAELAVLREMSWFERTVRTAAADLAPHLIWGWLHAFARKVHAFYEGETILGGDPALEQSRLALALAAASGLAAGLDLLGVSAPVRMERSP